VKNPDSVLFWSLTPTVLSPASFSLVWNCDNNKTAEIEGWILGVA